MVPMVETPEQVRAIVDCTRYPPAGRRGAAFNVAAHDDYSGGAETDKIARANARTMVIALVETATGIDNVEAIAAVDGIDVVWLGHYDLTNFLGIPGEFDNPKFHSAVDRLVKACRTHGKTPGFLAGNEQWARDFRARGFRMIAYGVDTLLMQTALAQGIKLLQATVTK
jgi:2-dehydro-3-deoxyglucarate aldolase/4-hydroxy-2-oxoheptanedioate aldolase